MSGNLVYFSAALVVLAVLVASVPVSVAAGAFVADAVVAVADVVEVVEVAGADVIDNIRFHLCLEKRFCASAFVIAEAFSINQTYGTNSYT